MTQPVDQPLLQESSPSPEGSPAKRRRTATTKTKATAEASAAKAPSRNGKKPAKAKVATQAKDTAAAEAPDLPGLGQTEPPVPQAETPVRKARAKAGTGVKRTPRATKASSKAEAGEPAAPRSEEPMAEAPKVVEAAALPPPRPASASPMPVEEWSPQRRATESPAPAAPRRPESPDREAPPASEAPAPPARKYPVYIPRHVARQLEEQGQTAPLAVPADAIPEAARAAVEAAQQAAIAAQQPPAGPSRQEGGPAGHAPSHPHPQPAPREHDREGGRERDRGRGGRDHRGRDRHRHGDRDRDRDFEREQDPERDYVASEVPLEGEVVIAEGIVEISGKGFGFIRDAKRSFAQHPQDVFVTPEIVRRYHLRDGQWIKGETRRGGRGAQLCQLLEVNGHDPEQARILPAFDELTVVSPMERIVLETTPERNTTRIIDLFAPIGKGQRGLIVAPPRTGKTTFLQHIADAVVKNHPDIVLIILLVDERPEEVTDIKRTVPKAEIMASSNDMDVKSHTRIAQLAIERAKRLVESGRDVFVLLDSITRVGRAFNNAMAGGGRTMSGGVDARALEIPRRLFAGARNTEEAGSLTIVATALIDTGSKADELIFQEFKGTGNMELVLDRKISEQRIYPAIDLFQSGTRREELLIPADDLHKIALIRRGLAGHKPMEAIERLLFFLRKFPTNAQMLREIPG